MNRRRTRDNLGEGTAWAMPSEVADGHRCACATHRYTSDSGPLCSSHPGILSHRMSAGLPPPFYPGLCPISPHQPLLPSPDCAIDQPHPSPTLLLNLTPDISSACLSTVCLRPLEGKLHAGRASVLSTALPSAGHSAWHVVGTWKYVLTICFGRQGENPPRRRVCK